MRDNEEIKKESKKTVDGKDGELLKMKDQMLSLKIEMKTLEKQTQYDLHVREEVRQIMFGVQI